MNPNKALWEQGDFVRLAAMMRGSAAAFVGTLGVTAGMTVLDLACGDGNTALPAAEAGADVLGIDIAANLVRAGQARAAAAGLSNLHFQEGDASHLRGIADARFDLVVSMFGAMFAPRPFDVAREMVRVTKPGGRIAMGNWIPGDPTLVAQTLRISSAYAPPPPQGFVSPMTWGVAAEVEARFGAAGIAADRISCEPTTYVFRHDGPAVDLLDTLRLYYGPTMNAFAAAAADGREDALRGELADLIDTQNQGGPDAVLVPATFLKVIVRKP